MSAGSGAGPQQCHDLPAAPQAVKELQTSTREAIVLLKAMIEEVRNSASEEESAINALFSGMQVRGCGAVPVGVPPAPCPVAWCWRGAEPQDKVCPCCWQEQLSDRKKALLKAVQR